MKLILIFSIILMTVGCFKDKGADDKNTPTPVIPLPVTPEPTGLPVITEEDSVLFRICDLTNISKCEIPEKTVLKLAMLSFSENGRTIDSMLDFKSVRIKFHLSDEQVLCLKDNYCNEDF